jgi:CxxC motif-containing protein (DUF1111 family)
MRVPARRDNSDGEPWLSAGTRKYLILLLAVWVVIGLAWLLTRGGQRHLTAAQRGAQLFRAQFTVAEGLGPLFNRRSCAGCHGFPSAGGVGRDGLATELRVGRITPSGFDPMLGVGGPFAREHSISELGVRCSLSPGIPAGANLSSVRNSPPLFGDGLIDAIPDRVILSRAAAERRLGVPGTPNLIRGPDGSLRVGRFGWKGDIPTLQLFVAGALRNELGVTNPLAATDSLPRGAPHCPGESTHPEATAQVVAELTAFVSQLPAPESSTSPVAGQKVFDRLGCDVCHVPTLGTGQLRVNLYSDLLLHDMGPALDDHVVQGRASGSDWRTAPLWGLATRTRYLHDGRATTLTAAIEAHGGEAAPARKRFTELSATQRASLLAFLKSL